MFLLLIKAYGREDGYSLSDMSGSQIARKLELCTSVLKVLDVITPGFSVSRGTGLHFLSIHEFQIKNRIRIRIVPSNEVYNVHNVIRA